MTTKMKNPDVNGNYENKYNSEDFREPEFKIEVTTSFGKFQLEAYNLGRGFCLEHEFITPVIGTSIQQLPEMTEIAISQLENNLDTMT